MDAFLSQLKKLIPAISGVIVLLIGLFSLDNILPIPMASSLQKFTSIILFLALIFSYFFRNEIVKRYKTILITTLILLVFLIIFNSLFVIQVSYNDGTTHNVLIGISMNEDFSKSQISDSDLIKMSGTELESLKLVYNYYDLTRILFILVFLCFMFLLIFCLSGLLGENPNEKLSNE